MRFAASVIELSDEIMKHCKFELSIEVPVLSNSSQSERLELSAFVVFFFSIFMLNT